MGDLILCNYPIAAMPFYLEVFSANIYSLEELCYYIEHNLLLLEEDFLEEEIIFWIEKEVGAKELADKLRLSIQEKKGLADVLMLLYQETGYWDAKTAGELVAQLKGLSEKSILERRKLRADRYVQKKKYVSAILEYRKILLLGDVCKSKPEICGAIWHNQGVCFAKLFLFDEAKECFLTAYKYHRKMESIYQALMASAYLGEEGREIKEQYGVSDGTYTELFEKWKEILKDEEVLKFNVQLEELLENNGQGVLENQKLLQLLSDWKHEYQKNCR